MERKLEIEIDEGGYKRIKNAAMRINETIYLVGSRASNTHNANSDFDYIIPNINNKKWKKIKNSLPGAKNILENLPNRIDLLKVDIDLTKPYIKVEP